jgi:hypothetical protein
MIFFLLSAMFANTAPCKAIKDLLKETEIGTSISVCLEETPDYAQGQFRLQFAAPVDLDTLSKSISSFHDSKHLWRLTQISDNQAVLEVFNAQRVTYQLINEQPPSRGAARAARSISDPEFEDGIRLLREHLRRAAASPPQHKLYSIWFVTDLTRFGREPRLENANGRFPGWVMEEEIAILRTVLGEERSSPLLRSLVQEDTDVIYAPAQLQALIAECQALSARETHSTALVRRLQQAAQEAAKRNTSLVFLGP